MSETIPPERTRADLLEQLKADQRRRWTEGQPLFVEDYLKRHPELAGREQDLLDLIDNERVQRRRAGETPQPEEYLSRFPHLADDLKLWFGIDDLLSDLPTPLPAQTKGGNEPAVPPAVPGCEILGELGRGGMGIVYRARHLALKRDVALKTLTPEAVGVPELRARFLREAQAMARLNHPNVVQVFEVGAVPVPFFSMELAEGGSLEGRLRQGTLPPHDAAAVVETLARAMQHAHDKGVIHRDLKPANVLLQNNSTTDYTDSTEKKEQAGSSLSALSVKSVVDCFPKITDFGLAKRLDSEQGKTLPGVIIGSPSYMAPEQARGRNEEVGPLADVWALGAVLYECLTGRPPFKGANTLETLKQVIDTEPLLPSRLVPGIPADLEAVCLKCLEKQPSRRYASAEELADDLARFREGKPTIARPLGAVGRALKWVKRRPLVAGLGFAFVLSLLVGTGLSLGFAAHANQKAEEEIAARHRAETARRNADEARKQEATARRQLERAAYLTNVALTSRELSAANMPRARAALNACPKQLRNWEWHLLDRACHQVLRTLDGHKGTVNRVAFSPDGKGLASGGEDGTVRLWEIATGKQRVLKGHTGAVNCVVFHPGGKQLVSAGADKTVRIWDIASGKTVYVFKRHTGEVVDVSYHPSGNTLASAGNEGKVLIWMPSRPEKKPGELTTGGPAKAVAFSPDRRWLAAANGDEIAVWNLKAGKIEFRLHASAERGGLAFTPDGEALVSVGQQTSVKVWDLSGKHVPVYGLHGHTSGINGVAVPPRGGRFATAGWDRTVRVWSLDGGADQQPITLLGHTDRPTCVAFRPDGGLVASGDHDGSILLWDLRGRGRAELGELIGDMYIDGYACAFSPDGKRVAAAGWHLRHVTKNTAESEGEVRIWDLSAAKRSEPLLLHGHVGKALDVAFQPGGGLLATAGEDGAVRLWDAATGRGGAWLRGHKGAVNSVAFHPDGRSLASAGQDGMVRIWEVANGRERTAWKAGGAVQRLAFASDGKTLATAGADGTVRLWTADGKSQRLLRGHKGPVRCVAFDRAGRRLASGGDDGVVRLWDVATGQALADFRGHSGPVRAVAFDRAGSRLASGGGGAVAVAGEVIVWDVDQGVEALKLVGHQGPVSGLAFSPDGLDLVSVSLASLHQAEVYLWSGRPRR